MRKHYYLLVVADDLSECYWICQQLVNQWYSKLLCSCACVALVSRARSSLKNLAIFSSTLPRNVMHTKSPHLFTSPPTFEKSFCYYYCYYERLFLIGCFSATHTSYNHYIYTQQHQQNAVNILFSKSPKTYTLTYSVVRCSYLPKNEDRRLSLVFQGVV